MKNNFEEIKFTNDDTGRVYGIAKQYDSLEDIEYGVMDIEYDIQTHRTQILDIYIAYYDYAGNMILEIKYKFNCMFTISSHVKELLYCSDKTYTCCGSYDEFYSIIKSIFKYISKVPIYAYSDGSDKMVLKRTINYVTDSSLKNTVESFYANVNCISDAFKNKLIYKCNNKSRIVNVGMSISLEKLSYLLHIPNDNHKFHSAEYDTMILHEVLKKTYLWNKNFIIICNNPSILKEYTYKSYKHLLKLHTDESDYYLNSKLLSNGFYYEYKTHILYNFKTNEKFDLEQLSRIYDKKNK